MQGVVRSDILGKIEFSIDVENADKNTHLQLYTKSQTEMITF